MDITDQNPVTIVEVGPRDGLQNEATILDTSTKVAFIERIVASGITRIEATSFAHPRLVPQMADAEELMARVPRPAHVSYIGLVLNERGFHRAVDAGVDEVNIVVVASETFSQRNQGMSMAQGLASAEHIRELARDHGLPASVTIGATFGCPFEGEVPLDRLRDIIRRIESFAPDEIALADTIGVAVPRDVQERVGIARELTERALRCHFHNTRNTGYANALMAVAEGVVALDSSAGGIGGCPFAPAATGNIGTEDLLYAAHRSGIHTGVDMTAALASARFIEGELGTEVPALLTRAGEFPGALSATAG